MQEMKITKETDLEYTVLCLRNGENLINVLHLFQGEMKKGIIKKLEIELVSVGRELNINIFTFARENGFELEYLEDIDFENDTDSVVDLECALRELLVNLQHFIYGKNWLSAKCEANKRFMDRYRGY